ncbi:MAG: hypothetical protein KF708_14575 [Pirellulales bacterium]|nr:hypothetical protein [Pirellulales bacterium]
MAQWMLDEVHRTGELYQIDVIGQIEKRFGRSYTYYNDAGGQSIDRKVLSEFRKLTGNDVVWQRGEKMWRRRERGDEPSRLQP